MSKPVVLVTGATGFVGTWVLRHWRQHHREAELWGFSDRPAPSQPLADCYEQVDFRDPVAVRRVVEACRPSHVIHLAGLTGGASLADQLAVNVLGTENLYNALAEAHLPPELTVVQASSAAIYGLVRPDELPIREEQLPRPVGAYGIAKLAQDHLAVSTGYRTGMRIIRACIFNILGPGQPASLVPMAFISQLCEVAEGKRDRLKTGNTSPRRDFVDVRDVVRALDGLLTRGQAGEAYNVASGGDIPVAEVITMLLDIAGLDVPVETEPQRARAVDIPRVCGSAAKLFAATGWQPMIPLRDSLGDMWRDAHAMLSPET